nr:hypothetical protein [Bacillus piscicola]
MGLIQQEVEKAGIATISITHLLDLTKKVGVPRALHLRFPLGRSFGDAHRKDLQKQIVTDLLEAIQTIREPRTVRELPYRWRKS